VIWLGNASAAAAISEIEGTDRRSLNRRWRHRAARTHLASGRTRRGGVLGIAGRHFHSGFDGLGSHFNFLDLICMLYKQRCQWPLEGPTDPCRAEAPKLHERLQRAQNPYKPRIRGSRPGAERTVSAISPFRALLMWHGQSARRPVLPPSEQYRVLSEGLEGLRQNRANTGKDTHASL